MFTGYTQRRGALIIFLFFFALSASQGQSGSTYSRFDNLTLKVAVFGPSDEIFIWWGHAALVVENTRWGNISVFDWGIFTYPSDDFLQDFLLNNVQYKCAVGYGSGIYDGYIEEDRDITLYSLDLDAEGKEAILNFAEENVLPDNCYYDYHEFQDNCAIGIRRLLDIGTGGQIRERFENSPGRFSYQEHVRRYTWFRPFSDWFIGFLMGQTLDKPISIWEEMFLPIEIARHIVDFRYTDHADTERNLVKSVEIIHASKTRPPILNGPLTIWSRNLGLGFLAAVFFVMIELFRRKSPVLGRILWGISQSILGLLLGSAGTVLFYGRFMLPQDYIRQNFNLLFVNPLLFVMVPLGICTALNKPSRLMPEKILRILWTAAFAGAVFTLIIKILPFFYQQNQPTQFLMLPLAVVVSYIPHILRRIYENFKSLAYFKSSGFFKKL